MRCSVHTLYPSVSGPRRFISWHGLDLAPARRLSLARCLFSFSLIPAPPTTHSFHCDDVSIPCCSLYILISHFVYHYPPPNISWLPCLLLSAQTTIWSAILRNFVPHLSFRQSSFPQSSPSRTQSINSASTPLHICLRRSSASSTSHTTPYHNLIAYNVLTLRRRYCRQKGAFLPFQSNLRRLFIASHQSGVLQHVFWWSEGQGRRRICSQE